MGNGRCASSSPFPSGLECGVGAGRKKRTSTKEPDGVVRTRVVVGSSGWESLSCQRLC